VHALGGPKNAVYTGALVRLRPSATVVQLRRELDVLAGQHPDVASGSNYDMSDIAVSTSAIQRAIRPDVVAMWLFAILVGLAVLVMIGQVLARRAWASAAEFSTLRALGLTRSQFVVAVIVPTFAIAALGSLAAVAVAVVASPLTPVGPARIAEPDGGVAINVAILGIGAALMVVWLAIHVALAAWRGSRTLTRAEVPGTSRLAHRTAAAHQSAPASIGLRWALVPGRGPASIPLRSTILGAALAITTLVVAVTFNVALGRLNATPSLYGWNWNMAVDGGYVPLPANAVDAALSRVNGLAGWAGGNYGNVVIGGRLLPAVGLDSLHGTVVPSLLRGSQPHGPSQIALGATTMRAVGTRPGGSVGVEVVGVERRLRVTGEVVLPDFERGGFVATDLGVGAVTSSEVIHPTGIPPRATYNFFLLRDAPGASQSRVQSAVEAALAPICAHGTCNEFVDRRPHEVNTYDQIAWTPLFLSAVLGVLAAGMLAHALVTSVSRRRHDIGILKTLGFTRRQVSATVSWQATALMLVVLAIGLPLGLVAGRWIWTLFANQLGVEAEAPVPWVFVVCVVPAALLLGNLVAAIPAWSARNTKALATLRAE
jgi:hypothetical protein